MAEACTILHSDDTRLNKVQRLIPIIMGVKEGHIYAMLDEMLESTEFLFESSDRIKPPFPKLRLDWKTVVYPPSSSLSNASFGEWITADGDFSRFTRTNEEKHLNKLCATLYRKPKPIWARRRDDFNGDIRVEFNSNTVKREARKWEKIDLGIKLSILVFFSGSKQAVAKMFPKLFKKAVPKSKLKPPTWMEALHQFTDNMTQYDTVLKSRLYLVLFSMNETAKDGESFHVSI